MCYASAMTSYDRLYDFAIDGIITSADANALGLSNISIWGQV